MRQQLLTAALHTQAQALNLHPLVSLARSAWQRNNNCPLKLLLRPRPPLPSPPSPPTRKRPQQPPCNAHPCVCALTSVRSPGGGPHTPQGPPPTLASHPPVDVCVVQEEDWVISGVVY